MSRVLKEKVVILKVGNKKYKYTEILEEIVESNNIETIDLTEESPNHTPSHTPNSSPGYNQRYGTPFENSIRIHTPTPTDPFAE